MIEYSVGHITDKSARRTAATNAMSPSLASSPIQSTFADSKTLGRTSPVPTNGGRPLTGRGRQNSTQSLVDGARPPSASASNKPNGIIPGAADLTSVGGVTSRSIPEVKASMKESAVNSKGEHMIEDANDEDPEMRGGLVVGGKKEGTLKREETEVNGNATPSLNPTIVTTITTTKSGRASKPSTPAIPSFPEV